MKGFTGKNTPHSDLSMMPDDSAMGPHFANQLGDYAAAPLWIGGSEPSEGKNVGDTYKAVGDLASSGFLEGRDLGGGGTKASQVYKGTK